jgi:hypothetical protein
MLPPGLLFYFSILFFTFPLHTLSTSTMEDLDGLWKRLSLNDKEDNIFDLSSDVQPDKPTLAAKFYTRRVINVEAIARTFKPL